MKPVVYAGLLTVLAIACAPPKPSGDSDLQPDRNTISLEEVEAARVDNAYELVRMLHPMWLRKRGTNTLQNDGDIVVYLNDSRMGGPEALRQIETISITSIRFFDVGAANFKFGAGHPHGAIQVSTKLPVNRGG
jgi:hypothetical protein